MGTGKGAHTKKKMVCNMGYAQKTEKTAYTRTLNGYAKLDEVGGKAYALMRLAQANYNTAGGFVITTDAYTYWLETKRLPSNLPNQLQERLEWHSYEMTYPLIVRSSATVEDQKKASFAGMFESYTNINSFDRLLKSIVNIYENACSEKIQRYSKFHNIHEKEIKMGILVQRQLNPKYSGILFTRNPVNGKDEMVVTYTEGVPWKLVSGQDVGVQEVLTGKSEKFGGLYQIAKEIEEFLGAPQDIEWAFDGKEYIILQSRPITTLKAHSPESKRSIRLNNKMATLTGTPASLGYIRGKIQYIEDNIPLKEAESKFVKGNILATRLLWLDYDSLMSRAGAIVTHDSSITTHAAIIAREKRIPCIVGIDIKRLSRYAANFDEVIVDADNGRIVVPHPRIYHIRDKTGIKIGAMPEWTRRVDKEGIRIIDSLSHAVVNGKTEEYEDGINQAIKYMINNASSHPELSRPLFHRLDTFLQEDFAKLLFENHPRKHVIERFEYVDANPQAKPQETIDRLYLITKKYLNAIGELRVDGKRMWELSIS